MDILDDTVFEILALIYPWKEVAQNSPEGFWTRVSSELGALTFASCGIFMSVVAIVVYVTVKQARKHDREKWESGRNASIHSMQILKQGNDISTAKSQSAVTGLVGPAQWFLRGVQRKLSRCHKVIKSKLLNSNSDCRSLKRDSPPNSGPRNAHLNGNFYSSELDVGSELRCNTIGGKADIRLSSIVLSPEKSCWAKDEGKSPTLYLKKSSPALENTCGDCKSEKAELERIKEIIKTSVLGHKHTPEIGKQSSHEKDHLKKLEQNILTTYSNLELFDPQLCKEKTCVPLKECSGLAGMTLVKRGPTREHNDDTHVQKLPDVKCVTSNESKEQALLNYSRNVHTRLSYIKTHQARNMPLQPRQMCKRGQMNQQGRLIRFAHPSMEVIRSQPSHPLFYNQSRSCIMSLSSELSTVSVDEAVNDLLSGDFGVICLKYHSSFDDDTDISVLEMSYSCLGNSLEMLRAGTRAQMRRQTRRQKKREARSIVATQSAPNICSREFSESSLQSIYIKQDNFLSSTLEEMSLITLLTPSIQSASQTTDDVSSTSSSIECMYGRGLPFRNELRQYALDTTAQRVKKVASADKKYDPCYCVENRNIMPKEEATCKRFQSDSQLSKRSELPLGAICERVQSDSRISAPSNTDTGLQKVNFVNCRKYQERGVKTKLLVCQQKEPTPTQGSHSMRVLNQKPIVKKSLSQMTTSQRNLPQRLENPAVTDLVIAEENSLSQSKTSEPSLPRRLGIPVVKDLVVTQENPHDKLSDEASMVVRDNKHMAVPSSLMQVMRVEEMNRKVASFREGVTGGSSPSQELEYPCVRRKTTMDALHDQARQTKLQKDTEGYNVVKVCSPSQELPCVDYVRSKRRMDAWNNHKLQPDIGGHRKGPSSDGHCGFDHHARKTKPHKGAEGYSEGPPSDERAEMMSSCGKCFRRIQHEQVLYYQYEKEMSESVMVNHSTQQECIETLEKHQEVSRRSAMNNTSVTSENQHFLHRRSSRNSSLIRTSLVSSKSRGEDSPGASHHQQENFPSASRPIRRTFDFKRFQPYDRRIGIQIDASTQTKQKVKRMPTNKRHDEETQTKENKQGIQNIRQHNEETQTKKKEQRIQKIRYHDEETQTKEKEQRMQKIRHFDEETQTKEKGKIIQKIIRHGEDTQTKDKEQRIQTIRHHDKDQRVKSPKSSRYGRDLLRTPKSRETTSQSSDKQRPFDDVLKYKHTKASPDKVKKINQSNLEAKLRSIDRKLSSSPFHLDRHNSLQRRKQDVKISKAHRSRNTPQSTDTHTDDVSQHKYKRSTPDKAKKRSQSNLKAKLRSIEMNLSPSPISNDKNKPLHPRRQDTVNTSKEYGQQHLSKTALNKFHEPISRKPPSRKRSVISDHTNPDNLEEQKDHCHRVKSPVPQTTSVPQETSPQNQPSSPLYIYVQYSGSPTDCQGKSPPQDQPTIYWQGNSLFISPVGGKGPVIMTHSPENMPIFTGSKCVNDTAPQEAALPCYNDRDNTKPVLTVEQATDMSGAWTKSHQQTSLQAITTTKEKKEPLKSKIPVYVKAAKQGKTKTSGNINHDNPNINHAGENRRNVTAKVLPMQPNKGIPRKVKDENPSPQRLNNAHSSMRFGWRAVKREIHKEKDVVKELNARTRKRSSDKQVIESVSGENKPPSCKKINLDLDMLSAFLSSLLSSGKDSIGDREPEERIGVKIKTGSASARGHSGEAQPQRGLAWTKQYRDKGHNKRNGDERYHIQDGNEGKNEVYENYENDGSKANEEERTRHTASKLTRPTSPVEKPIKSMKSQQTNSKTKRDSVIPESPKTKDSLQKQVTRREMKIRVPSAKQKSSQQDKDTGRPIIQTAKSKQTGRETSKDRARKEAAAVSVNSSDERVSEDGPRNDISTSGVDVKVVEAEANSTNVTGNDRYKYPLSQESERLKLLRPFSNKHVLHAKKTNPDHSKRYGEGIIEEAKSGKKRTFRNLLPARDDHQLQVKPFNKPTKPLKETLKANFPAPKNMVDQKPPLKKPDMMKNIKSKINSNFKHPHSGRMSSKPHSPPNEPGHKKQKVNTYDSSVLEDVSKLPSPKLSASTVPSMTKLMRQDDKTMQTKPVTQMRYGSFVTDLVLKSPSEDSELNPPQDSKIVHGYLKQKPLLPRTHKPEERKYRAQHSKTKDNSTLSLNQKYGMETTTTSSRGRSSNTVDRFSKYVPNHKQPALSNVGKMSQKSPVKNSKVMLHNKTRRQLQMGASLGRVSPKKSTNQKNFVSAESGRPSFDKNTPPPSGSREASEALKIRSKMASSQETVVERLDSESDAQVLNDSRPTGPIKRPDLNLFDRSPSTKSSVKSSGLHIKHTKASLQRMKAWQRQKVDTSQETTKSHFSKETADKTLADKTQASSTLTYPRDKTKLRVSHDNRRKKDNIQKQNLSGKAHQQQIKYSRTKYIKDGSLELPKTQADIKTNSTIPYTKGHRMMLPTKIPQRRARLKQDKQSQDTWPCKTKSETPLVSASASATNKSLLVNLSREIDLAEKRWYASEENTSGPDVGIRNYRLETCIHRPLIGETQTTETPLSARQQSKNLSFLEDISLSDADDYRLPDRLPRKIGESVEGSPFSDTDSSKASAYDSDEVYTTKYVNDISRPEEIIHENARFLANVKAYSQQDSTGQVTFSQTEDITNVRIDTADDKGTTEEHNTDETTKGLLQERELVGCNKRNVDALRQFDSDKMFFSNADFKAWLSQESPADVQSGSDDKDTLVYVKLDRRGHRKPMFSHKSNCQPSPKTRTMITDESKYSKLMKARSSPAVFSMTPTSDQMGSTCRDLSSKTPGSKICRSNSDSSPGYYTREALNSHKNRPHDDANVRKNVQHEFLGTNPSYVICTDTDCRSTDLPQSKNPENAHYKENKNAPMYGSVDSSFQTLEGTAEKSFRSDQPTPRIDVFTKQKTVMRSHFHERSKSLRNAKSQKKHEKRKLPAKHRHVTDDPSLDDILVLDENMAGLEAEDVTVGILCESEPSSADLVVSWLTNTIDSASTYSPASPFGDDDIRTKSSKNTPLDSIIMPRDREKAPAKLTTQAEKRPRNMSHQRRLNLAGAKSRKVRRSEKRMTHNLRS